MNEFGYTSLDQVVGDEDSDSPLDDDDLGTANG